MHDAYVDVIGVAPKGNLLASSQSSYMNVTMDHFRHKLQALQTKWVLEASVIDSLHRLT